IEQHVLYIFSIVFLFFIVCAAHLVLHSFPTRRSSDLGAQYGGSTSAILINLPGESSSAVTAIDGHQMARQGRAGPALVTAALGRSEEHTSELQSRENLVCRLLLEKKKIR